MRKFEECESCKRENLPHICNMCVYDNFKPSLYCPKKKTEVKEDTVDWVNKPPHYTTGKFEVIDIIEDKLSSEAFEGYCVGNVMKYVMRYKNKGGYEDLKKAKRYIEILLEKKDIN